jgi:hypothetical protein
VSTLDQADIWQMDAQTYSFSTCMVKGTRQRALHCTGSSILQDACRCTGHAYRPCTQSSTHADAQAMHKQRLSYVSRETTNLKFDDIHAHAHAHKSWPHTTFPPKLLEAMALYWHTLWLSPTIRQQTQLQGHLRFDSHIWYQSVQSSM